MQRLTKVLNTSSNNTKKDNKAAKLLLCIFCVLISLSFTGCLKSSSPVRGNVTGRVYDSNGKALYEARVEVYGTDHSVLTDTMGEYFIEGVSPGQRRLVATYDGESVVKVVEVIRGETLTGIDLRFEVVDKIPPVITEVNVIDIEENRATVVWKTNEPADSNVDYALLPIGMAEDVMTASRTVMVKDHSVNLYHLMPGRTYHFRVRSRDFNYNEAVSSDYQFTTNKGEAPAAPQNFVLLPPTEMERVEMSWLNNTESDLAGYNLYRSVSATGPFERVNGSPIPPTEEEYMEYRDDGLEIGVKYYYQVRAVDIAGNESIASEIRSLVTVGTISQNRLWKAAESPYIIQGDIRVRAGAVLTIEPGTEIRFTRTNSLPDNSYGSEMAALIVQGGLMSVGTDEQKIVMTSAEAFPQKGNWAGVSFIGTNEPDNQMRHTTIVFADEAVRAEASSVLIEYSEFGLCGIGLNIGLSPSLNVRFNTIRDCDIGAVVGNSNIRNNLFIDNQVGISFMGSGIFENNTVDCLVGVQVDAGNPVIKNNIIAYTGTGRALYGINQTIELATPTISYNNIYNYGIPFNDTISTGTANIEVDPLFIGGTPFDYRLQTVEAGFASDSICLTAGENGVQMGRYGP